MIRGRWVGWVVSAWMGMVASGAGQTLAHRNWEGSGLRVETWWSRAVFCVAGSDLKRVAGEMDALARLGCDAVEVNSGNGYGSVEEMDAVTEGAGRRKMRVVVDLSGGEDAVAAGMGFWGARGAAGFSVAGDVSARMRQAAGGRLVIADGGGGQLRVTRIPEGDAAAVRGWLAGAVKAGVLLEDGEARLGYARAAMVLVSGVAARVRVDEVLTAARVPEEREFSAEEMLLWVPKERATGGEMVEWVRGLSELRQKNATLHTGSAVFLDFDAFGVVGWAVPARDGRGAVLVICNLSGRAVRVPLAGAVKAAGVRGSLVKTLLRSDGSGSVSLEGIKLGVDGVFVGEIR